jgi:hypothetical protein
MELYRSGVINLERIAKVETEWQEPSFEELVEGGPTAWRLFVAIRPDIHTCPFGCATETEGQTNGVSASITADGYNAVTFVLNGRILGEPKSTQELHRIIDGVCVRVH